MSPATAQQRITEVSTNLAERLLQAALPGQPFANLDVTSDFARAEVVIPALTSKLGQSSHAYGVAGILEHLLKIIREPTGQFAGVYRFNVLQGCDSLEARLEIPHLNTMRLDIGHRAEFLEILYESRRAIAATLNGNADETQRSFKAAVVAAFKVVGNTEKIINNFQQFYVNTVKIFMNAYRAEVVLIGVRGW